MEGNSPRSLSIFRVSFSSNIIIIYILFTVNAHRFLHPYAKETESNHFTMLHPLLNVYVTLVKLYCWRQKSFISTSLLPHRSHVLPPILSLSHTSSQRSFFFVSCSFHFYSVAAAWHLSMMNSHHIQNDFRHNVRSYRSMHLKHIRIKKIEIFSSLLYYICHFVQSFSVRWWVQHEYCLLSFASKRKPL